MKLSAGLPDIGAELVDYALDALERHIADEVARLNADPMTYGLPPHEVQERLHMATARHVLLVAANRIGKTTGGVREVLWRARGDHPYKRIRPHRFIVIGVPDFTFYREASEPIWREWLPPSWLIDENKSEKWFKIRRVDGGICTVQFKTFDQGRKSWQGFAADFIWLDEEHPEEIYREAFARIVTTRGDLLQTFTPVGGLGWTYDRIYLPAKRGRRRYTEVIEGALAEYDETKPYGVGRILVPHLSYEDVLGFAQEYPDEDERAIRVFGKYRARAGTVLKMFQRSTHLIRRFEVPDFWMVWGAVDPGFRGFAASWYAMSPDGFVVVVSEYFSQHEATGDRLRAMHQRFREQVRPTTEQEDELRRESGEFGVDEEPCIMFVDTEDPQAVLDLNLAAQEAEVPFIFVSLDQGLKARKAGILLLQRLLNPEPSRTEPEWAELSEPSEPEPARLYGTPRIYVFNDLYSEWMTGDELHKESRLIFEIERWRWKKPPRSGAIAPDDADDHSADGAHMLSTFRYALMARLGAPEEPQDSGRVDIPEFDAVVWADMEDLEREMLEEAGLLP